MNPAMNGGTMTTNENRPDYFGDMRRRRPRWNVEFDQRRAMRAELIDRLIEGGSTPEQAANIAGACAAYGTLSGALDTARGA